MSLWRALVGAWTELRRGDHARATGYLEAEVIAVVCDLEALTVEDWERARAELESARPV